jgi:hypothetical protein
MAATASASTPGDVQPHAVPSLRASSNAAKPIDSAAAPR